MNQTRIYLSLGSNLGNRHQHLAAAKELISDRVGHPDLVSRVYESTPWGFQSDRNFYNHCMSLLTHLDPLPLIDEILRIEINLGRIRSGRSYTDRLIDIDLLFYGSNIINYPGLIVPHPAIASRRFVLEPLAEIAQDLIHPVSGLTIKAILAGCTDHCTVNPVINY